MTAYLNFSSSPEVNFYSIARANAYITHEISKLRKEIETYEIKRNLCLLLMVSATALAILLGSLLKPYFGLLFLNGLLPLTAWYLFYKQKQALEKKYVLEHKRCLEIIADVANFLDDIRTAKIELMLDTRPATLENLKLAEKNYDDITHYLEICDLAKNANAVISEHYPSLLTFKLASERLYKANTPKIVLSVENSGFDRPLWVSDQKASYHPSFSVIKTNATQFAT